MSWLATIGLWWSGRAWPWLRKNWYWVVFFPVMLFIYILGRGHGRVVVVDKREESDAARKFEEEVEAKKKKAIDAAEKERVEKTEEVVRTHVDTIQRLTEEQKAEADALLDDPSALNDYLSAVGSRARGTTD